MDKAEKKRLADEKKAAAKAAKAAAKETKRLEKEKAAAEKKAKKEAAAAAKKAKKAGKPPPSPAAALAPPAPAEWGDGSATSALKARASQRASSASKAHTAAVLASMANSFPAPVAEDDGADTNAAAAAAAAVAEDDDGLDDLGDAFDDNSTPAAAAADQEKEAAEAPPSETAPPVPVPEPEPEPAAAAAAAAAEPKPASEPNLYEMAGSAKTADELSTQAANDRTEAWEQAASWLTELGALPKIDPEVLKQFSRAPNVYDFIVTLKSGVALCNALNTLVPGTTKPYPNPNKQFLRDKNINKFLDGCLDVGVAEEDLFLTEHLSEGSSIPAVVHTIAVLSQLDVAKERGLASFDVPEDDEEMFAGLYSNVEDVIQSFEEDLATQEEDSIYELAASGGGGEGLYGLANAEEMTQQVSLYEMADSSKVAAEEDIDMNAHGAIYELAKQRSAPPSADPTYELAAATTPAAASSGGGRRGRCVLGCHECGGR